MILLVLDGVPYQHLDESKVFIGSLKYILLASLLVICSIFCVFRMRLSPPNAFRALLVLPFVAGLLTPMGFALTAVLNMWLDRNPPTRTPSLWFLKPRLRHGDCCQVSGGPAKRRCGVQAQEQVARDLRAGTNAPSITIAAALCGTGSRAKLETIPSLNTALYPVGLAGECDGEADVRAVRRPGRYEHRDEAFALTSRARAA